MRLAAAILAATAFVPSAFAGMYGNPVINLDAKDFKKAMATEHAAVCNTQASIQHFTDWTDGSICSSMVWAL
jgi:protein disulfide-isomerase A6